MSPANKCLLMFPPQFGMQRQLTCQQLASHHYRGIGPEGMTAPSPYMLRFAPLFERMNPRSDYTPTILSYSISAFRRSRELLRVRCHPVVRTARAEHPLAMLSLDRLSTIERNKRWTLPPAILRRTSAVLPSERSLSASSQATRRQQRSGTKWRRGRSFDRSFL